MPTRFDDICGPKYNNTKIKQFLPSKYKFIVRINV